MPNDYGASLAPPMDASWFKDLLSAAQEEMQTFIGYPCNGAFDYTPLYPLLRYSVNNVGDPFASSTYRLNTKEIERQVVEWFTHLTHADPSETWGYVTNGGSEGNLYGLFLARELHPEALVYYSEETHYSVAKNLRMLRFSSIMLRSRPNGEIDYEDLRETLRIHRQSPAVIFANIGTTMKEAVDDIERIRGILRELAIPLSYIHADAAFDGMTLPFIDGAPSWDFAAGIDSLSISGHKLIGAPFPSGIVLARKGNVDRIARSIEYVGTLDTTVTGSRNAIAPVFLWHAIQTHGYEGFRRVVGECLEVADYAIERLRGVGVSAWRNPHALTVVFPRPPKELSDRWQIAINQQSAHIICVPHVTREMVDRFVDDWARLLPGVDAAGSASMDSSPSEPLNYNI